MVRKLERLLLTSINDRHFLLAIRYVSLVPGPAPRRNAHVRKKWPKVGAESALQFGM